MSVTVSVYVVTTTGVTVSNVDPLIAPDVAVIVAGPAATPLAWPAVVETLLTVAVAAEEVVHTADAVRFCVVPFEYLPIAVNCTVPPTATEGFAGVTAMETNVGAAAVTVRVVEPSMFPEVAVIVAVPGPLAVAKPLAAIVATFRFDELHVAVVVRFWMLPSLYVPVAVNCCVLPFVIEGVAGVTVMVCNVAPGKLEISNMATSSTGVATPQLVHVVWKPFTVVGGVVFWKKFAESVRARA
jgi:hypothetical protein